MISAGNHRAALPRESRKPWAEDNQDSMKTSYAAGYNIILLYLSILVNVVF